MARIRSIKPDFFQSETIAVLPLSARLLFIGMWTHADDNGVMVDSAKLINAAVWPLEDDPLESLRRTQEDLQRLSAARLIVRYEGTGKRLIFIRGWDEHQKVSHPGKPRYPRQTAEQLNAVTCENNPITHASGEPPEALLNASETLVPEQGAGSREQGKENTSPPAARAGGTEPGSDRDDDPTASQDLPSTAGPPTPGSDADPDWVKFWDVYPLNEGKADARKSWAKAIQKSSPAEIIAGAERYRERVARENRAKRHIKHASGWLDGERWNDENTFEPGQPPTGTDGRYMPGSGSQVPARDDYDPENFV